MKVGREFKSLMEARGMKQYMLAATLKSAGFKVSRTQLSRILNDQVDPPLGVFVFIAKTLGEKPSSFLGDEGSLPIGFLGRLQDLLTAAKELFPPEALPTESDDSRTVPLLRVAATPENETYDDEVRTCEVPPEFYTRNVQAFEVVGNSMSGDGILAGDIVYTRPPRNEVDTYEEIVVAMVGGYRHLKRLQHRRGRIQLVSSAAGHKAWKFDRASSDFEVLGIVTGCVRRMAR